jgi:hypothetical protein
MNLGAEGSVRDPVHAPGLRFDVVPEQYTAITGAWPIMELKILTPPTVIKETRGENVYDHRNANYETLEKFSDYILDRLCPGSQCGRYAKQDLLVKWYTLDGSLTPLEDDKIDWMQLKRLNTTDPVRVPLLKQIKPESEAGPREVGVDDFTMAAVRRFVPPANQPLYNNNIYVLWFVVLHKVDEAEEAEALRRAEAERRADAELEELADLLMDPEPPPEQAGPSEPPQDDQSARSPVREESGALRLRDEEMEREQERAEEELDQEMRKELAEVFGDDFDADDDEEPSAKAARTGARPCTPLPRAAAARGPASAR